MLNVAAPHSSLLDARTAGLFGVHSESVLPSTKSEHSPFRSGFL